MTAGSCSRYCVIVALILVVTGSPQKYFPNCSSKYETACSMPTAQNVVLDAVRHLKSDQTRLQANLDSIRANREPFLYEGGFYVFVKEMTDRGAVMVAHGSIPSYVNMTSAEYSKSKNKITSPKFGVHMSNVAAAGGAITLPTRPTIGESQKQHLSLLKDQHGFKLLISL